MERLADSRAKLIKRFSSFGAKTRSSSLRLERASLESVSTNQDDHFPSGIKVLHDPLDPIVDIVLVHGLTGDRERTWTHPATGACWPRDLLPQQLPHARILTFGYDAYVVRPREQVARIDIAHHATDFLNCLANERTDPQSSKRPLLVVTHSLGGLLCKDALRISQNNTEARLRVISDHIWGIVFIATPHGGSWLAKWAKTSASMLGVVKSADISLLSLLKSDSEVLGRIHDEFLSTLIKRQTEHRPIKIACFYEVLPLRGRIKIVEKESATISGFNNVSIHADHRNIARFKSKDDPGYKHVLGVLGSWTNETSDTSGDMEVDALLGSLASPEMGVRKAAIEPAEMGTCEWLSSHPCYKAWAFHRRLEESHGLLWIKGKPGAGKSTIMKHAFLNLRPSPKACRLGFFFNARGSQEERSASGLLKSLLHQVVSSFPNLRGPLLEQYRFKKQQSGKAMVIWSLPELRELLHDLIIHAGKTPIEIFVDALDECNEDEVRSVVAFFSRCCSDALANNTTLRICWSSRHYRHVTVDHHLQILVDNMNSADIKLWVHRHLAQGNRPVLLENFGAQVVAKANGSFLWSVLVVNKICQLADKGLPMSKIGRVINDLPSELNALYKNVLVALDPDLSEDALALIYLVLFAFEPFDIDALRIALEFMSRSPPTSLDQLENVQANDLSFRLFVTEISGGLLEVVDANPTLDAAGHDAGRARSIVQPIHESVRDFLLNGGLNFLPQFKQDRDLAESGHLAIYRACTHILSTQEMRCVLLRPKRFFSDIPKLVESGRSWLQTSLLNCVMKYMFLHLIQGYPDLSTQFAISSIQKTTAISRNAIVESMRHWMSVNAVAYMSRRHLDHLAEALSMEWEMNELDFCALDDHFGLCALLDHGEQPSDNELDKVIIALAHHGLDFRISEYIARFRELKQTTPFSRFSGVALESAIKGHHLSTTKLLIENGEIHRPVHLILAIQEKQAGIVQLLVEDGADVNQSAMGKIPIIEAISTGCLDVINILFRHGANINREYRGKIVICEAIGQGRRDIVETLLDHGAAVNYAASGKIPINQAVASGFEDIVELLLQHGASVDIHDEEGQTALTRAQNLGREDIINMVRLAATSPSRAVPETDVRDPDTKK